MIVIKLLYLALLIGLSIFYVLYIDSFALIMLICALLVPILLKGILLWLKFSSSAVLTCDADSCAAGESVPITITVRSRSPFSFPQAQAIVLLRHSFGSGTEKLRLRFPLQARNLTRITFYVHADFCGAMELTLKKISVLDYLHLFHTNLIVRQKHASLLVLPQCVRLPVFNSSDPVFSPDSDVFGERPGDDPSQIFGFHEYGMGDAISRIHWKLSSKSDKLFVKEFSMPIQKSVLLILNYSSSARESMQTRIQKAETFLTLFYSVACQMLEQHVLPEIVWYDEAQQKFEMFRPTAKGQMTDVFRSLYDAISGMELDVQRLMDVLSGTSYSSLTCITNHMPKMLLDIVDKQLNANQKTMLYVCGQEDDSVQISDNIEQTAVLWVHSGRIQEDIPQLLI